MKVTSMNGEKTRFISKIEQNHAKFGKLMADFYAHDDPVDRYIKRQQMIELQEWLKEFGISVEVP